ncbi:MAG: right-handed parallel beta-helix repeat-containing protein, partial [Candidatus Bathyarchaeota archaeon]
MTKTKTCLSVGVLLTACLLFSSNIVVAETETVWDRTYGMYGSGRQVIQTSDGGYAIAGVTDGQCLLLKTDSSGSREWTQTYGNGSFSSIVQTADEGYALAGSGDSINFVKTDSEGNIQWSRHYNNSGVPFHINSVIQTSEGGYALAGWTSENPYSLEWDWTVKTDSYGDIMWSKTFGLSRGNSLVQEILQAPDGGYVLAANQNISKLDSAGNIQWTNNAVIASSLTKTADGGYLLAAGNGGGLIKFDESGNREWNNVYRFEGAKWSFLHSVAQTGDGGYVLAGVTYPVYDGLGWVLKISENGTLEGEVSFPPERGINNSINSIIEADDGNYVFTGFKNAPDRTGLLWVAKVAPTTVIPEFPQWMPLLIMLVAVIAVAVIYRRRMSRRSQGSKIVKKSVSLLISLLLLISVVVSLPQIKTVKAAPVTIYIKEDGSIVGTDKIRQYGDTYRFIEDVNSGDSPYGISIERDNIVVDGAGYTLQGNFNTCQPNSGVSIYGVHIRASHITLRNLNIENYRDGIQQYSVSNNHFADNSITYCNIGIFFSSSPNNMLRSNKLENNGQHLKISVDNLAEYNNDIDQSNTVDGKPIIYWLRKSDSIIPPAAGLVFLINCTKMTIKNLHLSSSGQNILLDSTTNSTIQHNTLLGNGKYAGIHLRNSNNIQIIGNTIKNQSEGIHLHDSSNNHINQNQILNNAIGVEIRTSNNNEVSNNTFSKNGEGVYSTAFNVIWGEVTYSIGNTISNNTLTGNNNGISIEGENLVKGNVVTGNSGAAI